MPSKLSEFTVEQVQDLACRYGLNWSDRDPIEQLMNMVGGHPYLVHLALYHLAILLQNRLSVDREEPGEEMGRAELAELLAAAPTHSGIYSDYLTG